jgi:predicted nucleic acid-binding protein
VYLLDTNIISETRKGARANRGVQRFSKELFASGVRAFISAPTFGEIRYGVERLRYRGDLEQAEVIERWLTIVLREYAGRILPFDEVCAQLWGRMMVPDRGSIVDKQIAAVAQAHQLTLVTRNVRHFAQIGVPLLNPFTEDN